MNAGTAPTKESVERAKFAAQRALSLAGDRAEGPLAMGAYLQHVALDYSGARTQYLEGLKRDASNADLLVGLATLETRARPLRRRLESRAPGAASGSPFGSQRPGVLPARCTISVAIPKSWRRGTAALALATGQSRNDSRQGVSRTCPWGALDSVHALVEQT